MVTKLRRTKAPWVALPFEYSNGPVYPGQSAGFLGLRYAPLWVKDDVNAPNFRQNTLGLPSEMTLERLSQRRNLLVSLEKVYDRVARTATTAEMTAAQGRALELITTPKIHQAFQLDRESDRLRTRYGRNLFGQSCLLARRLVEAGIPLVLVESFGADGFPRGGTGWDMHTKIFDTLKTEVFPIQDRGFAVLLEDLATRGLLDETLVVWTTEFGRSPKINQYAGRDHWPYVYTVLFAGAGVQAGVVYGSSDRLAAYPATNPVTPQDIAATIYHCLGINPHTLIHDQQGRPFEVGSGGEPIWGILA